MVSDTSKKLAEKTAEPKMLMPTDEELQKMSAEIEDFRANMTQEQRDEFNRRNEELAKVMENMPNEGEGYRDYAWMVNPSVSAKSYRERLQEEGTFDARYAGMDESTRQYFDQRIKEEENELAKINAEAEAYRASLTKEQRTAFDRGVAELAKKMQGVPEQGLATYIGRLPQAWSWGEPEIRQLEWWWASKPAEERNSSAIEQAIRENHEYLQSIKRAEQEKAIRMSQELRKKL